MDSGFFSGIVAGKLDTFGDLDEDGEESDEILLCGREWRASELDGLGVGGRLRGLLPNTALARGGWICSCTPVAQVALLSFPRWGRGKI